VLGVKVWRRLLGVCDRTVIERLEFAEEADAVVAHVRPPGGPPSSGAGGAGGGRRARTRVKGGAGGGRWTYRYDTRPCPSR
jgi:hypothetical protein